MATAFIVTLAIFAISGVVQAYDHGYWPVAQRNTASQQDYQRGYRDGVQQARPVHATGGAMQLAAGVLPMSLHSISPGPINGNHPGIKTEDSVTHGRSILHALEWSIDVHDAALAEDFCEAHLVSVRWAESMQESRGDG
jgi:hypothetical protein